MQLNKVAAFVVYAGSYLPLSMILLAQDYTAGASGAPICKSIDVARTGVCYIPFDNPSVAILTFLFCLLCAVAALLLLRMVSPAQRVKVLESKYVPADLMNYVLPYIVSFMGLSYSDEGKLLGFLIFFFWIFWITYSSGQVIMNPLLAAFGWRLYEVVYSYEGDASVGSRKSGFALSKGDVEVGKVYPRALLQDVLVFKSVLLRKER